MRCSFREARQDTRRLRLRAVRLAAVVGTEGNRDGGSYSTLGLVCARSLFTVVCMCTRHASARDSFRSAACPHREERSGLAVVVYGHIHAIDGRCTALVVVVLTDGMVLAKILMNRAYSEIFTVLG